MTDFFSYLESKFGKQEYTRPQFEQQPPITMTFAQFLHDSRRHSKHNLYLVWKGKHALYVGIAHEHIWTRWFNRGSQGHMLYYWTPNGKTLSGASPIGAVIQRNLPKSLKWKVELRHFNTFSWCPDERLEDAEHRLIQEFRPLFNTTYRPSFTDKENKLIERLTNVNF
jgi:hypothetical protein